MIYDFVKIKIVSYNIMNTFNSHVAYYKFCPIRKLNFNNIAIYN